MSRKSHPLSGYARTLIVGSRQYRFFSLQAASDAGLGDVSRLPRSLKILLENLLCFADGQTVAAADIEAVASWTRDRTSRREIPFRPARILMQDFTGVPAVVDLSAMRDALTTTGRDPETVNPLVPVDLVIDHSVQVDRYASPEAFAENVGLEMERNRERYAFLRWGQSAFRNFRVVPPGTGICHQVNLEYLAQVVRCEEVDGEYFAYPDSLVGTDSHTTMINGLGVLGWGVGGIEAEAAMLGQPISMLIPEVVGVRLSGALGAGVTATDLVLTVTEMLRRHGVVGKFVEFCGSGLSRLPLADRATIANMAPEYGATCGFFPIDQVTVDYLRFTGRDEQTVALVEAYAKAQGLWHDATIAEPLFTDLLELDLATVVPCLAGPKRPQDRLSLGELRTALEMILPEDAAETHQPVPGTGYSLRHGDVVIAAITSCTNTSNPAVMMAAGLLAQKAVALGLRRKPWVKTSLAPGSKVVTDYLREAGLQESLDALGFHLVGYGCTTCIGNSGPLDAPIAAAIREGDLTVSAVLSGNRNFEGRIHPQVKANWLASPPLVVAFALAGTTRIDLSRDSLGTDRDGRPVFLRDLWPDDAEVAAMVAKVSAAMFRKEYADVFAGDAAWRSMAGEGDRIYRWDPASTYIRKAPFFDADQGPSAEGAIRGARILALLGDSITTDHISPAGAIRPDSPAGRYLQEKGVTVDEFNSYGARRGNHEVMVRGTFANIRLRNAMVPHHEGGFTRHHPGGEEMTIYDAAKRYREKRIPLIVVAGKEYGTGSSRDWAAKGPLLLGVRAVIAESFERIHRSNLIGMGIMPLQFLEGDSASVWQLDGSEVLDLFPPHGPLAPGQTWQVEVRRSDGSIADFSVNSRLDTVIEVAYIQAGGILQYVLANLSDSLTQG